MFSFIHRLVEERIKAAQEAGAFDGLPGAGKPLNREDDSVTPEDLRMAYHVLKNAGCLPPEMEMHKEILTLRGLLASTDDESDRIESIRKLNFLVLKLNMLRGRPVPLEVAQVYDRRIAERLAKFRAS